MQNWFWNKSTFVFKEQLKDSEAQFFEIFKVKCLPSVYNFVHLQY